MNQEFPMLGRDAFLLVIMTSFQASLFEEFSNKIICIDSTHKTNEYRFKLITIVVPDEYCNGKIGHWCACGLYIISSNYIQGNLLSGLYLTKKTHKHWRLFLAL